MFGAAQQKANINPNNDVEVQTPPDLDGVSSLQFSPTGNFFVATSWNNQAYMWEYNAQGQTIPKLNTAVQQPILCSAWTADGSHVFLGGCDKTVKMWNLQTNQVQQVAQHDAPVRHVAFASGSNVLVTGSWDKTIKYWDCRQPTPAGSVALSERVYAMDLVNPCLVVGTADRNLHVINLANPGAIYKTMQSQLKWQTRCVSVFPDKQGFLVGSIEGRVAVTHIDDTQASKNFTFKCHRDGADIYAVNALNFHPVFGTFATAGSDGTYNFWDKDSKQRLKANTKAAYTPQLPAPIPCANFNRDGTLYGYALSYDWSKGYAEYQPQTMKNYIFLHACKEDEVKAKPKTGATTVTNRR